MRRYLALLVLGALVAVACGDASTPTTAAPGAAGATAGLDLSGVAMEVHAAPG